MLREKYHQVKKLYKKYIVDGHTQRQLAAIICFLFACLYALLMLHKYWQLEYFFVDNVYFHTSLWKLAQFENPIVYHRLLGEINIFGDHFHPAIMIVALLFRIFPWHETVFISMAIAYSIGGYFAFLIGQKVIKHVEIIFLLLLSYFLYIGSQHAFLFGFHEINLLSPFFFIMIWSLLFKKRWIYWLSFLFLLLTKESMAIVGACISIYIFFIGKKYKKTAVITFFVSIIWFVIATRLIIPYFSGGRFLYSEIDYPKNIDQLIVMLTEPAEKINTVFISIFSFGFLPILNLATLPLILQDFLVRYVFTIPGNVQYRLTYHYGVGLAPMLLFSSIWTVKQIEKRKHQKMFLIVFSFLTLLGIFYGNFMLDQRAPLLLVFNKAFYQNTQNNSFLWRLINAVPKTGSVMTQNHLGLPLSKQNVYMLADSSKSLLELSPDYLVYDLREGQNPNNFFPISETLLIQIVDELIQNQQYKIFFNEGDLYILERV